MNILATLKSTYSLVVKPNLKIGFLCGFLILITGCVQMPKTAEHDPSVQSIEFNGFKFHYETAGDPNNPVVIVLHGGPGADYRYLLPMANLADEYFVVFYDQLGTGLSQRVESEEITVNSFIRDLNSFVDHFGRGKPVRLIGHSWGAMLASAFTGQYPNKVEALVMAEPGFVEYQQLKTLMDQQGGPSAKMIWGLSTAWFNKWRAHGDAFAKNDFFMNKAILLFQSPEELCEGQLPNMQFWRFGSSNFDATIGRTMKDDEFAKTLNFARGIENYAGDVLMLTGACNQLTGFQYQEQFLPYYPGTELISIPDAGHFMLTENPEAAKAQIDRFFKRGL